MNTRSILVLLFIVLIIYVTLVPYSHTYHKRCLYEKFVNNSSATNETSIEWSSFNQMAKRALTFKPPHTDAIASQRAETNNTLTFDPTANCTTSRIPSNLNNDAQSLVSENDILYKLTSSCFSFTANSLQSGTKLPLTLDNTSDWFKYVYLTLLNPTFLEINKNNFTTTSIAYHITNRTPSPITNKGFGDFSAPAGDRKQALLNLKPLTDSYLFNYNNKQPAYQELQKLNVTDKSPINIKAFYLRPYDSTQSVGTSITFVGSKSTANKFLVSSSTYNTLPNIDNNKAIKLMSTTIDRYYNNTTRSVYPTFTVSFKLNMKAANNGLSGKKYMALEMCMNNEVGLSSSCNNGIVYSPNFVKNGNIVSLAVEYPTANTMKLYIGTSTGGCLYNNASSQAISLNIPTFSTANTTANCTLTVSPYTLDFLAYWVSPDAKEKEDNVQFIYQQQLLPQGNDFHQLFIGPIASQSANRFADVVINTNTETVPSVNEVQLGHKNLAEVLYKAIHLGQ